MAAIICWNKSFWFWFLFSIDSILGSCCILVNSWPRVASCAYGWASSINRKVLSLISLSCLLRLLVVFFPLCPRWFCPLYTCCFLMRIAVLNSSSIWYYYVSSSNCSCVDLAAFWSLSTSSVLWNCWTYL
jgi:hypothetical protein